MGRPFKLTDWQIEAASLMARTGCSLKQAAVELGQEITSEDCRALFNRPSFQKELWTAKHRYNIDLARDPDFNQDSVVGKMLALAQKLEEEGANDKAAEVLLKISKIRGWLGPESAVNIFGELSQKDLDAIRETVSKPQKVQ
jgi:hypothetical protein